VLRAPVVRLPGEGFEHVFRHLLTLNDESAGLHRLSVFDNTVYLSMFRPIASVDAHSFPSTVSEFAMAAASYRQRLARHFSAEPAFEHEVD
jgi:hypothetical protein